jgi:phage N-6-adenine-methyltransferase
MRGLAYHPPSSSTEWMTPEWLFDRLYEEFHFQIDACASASDTQCQVYIDKEQDCLVTGWDFGKFSPRASMTPVWMNPPWGRGVGKFIQRAYEQSREHRMVVVCLLPANTDTKWWRDWVWRASEVRFITGRLHFTCSDGRTGPCPTGACVVVFTPWGEGPPKCSLIERSK